MCIKIGCKNKWVEVDRIIHRSIVMFVKMQEMKKYVAMSQFI